MTLNQTLTAIPLRSRILGCWLGKSIGGTLGLPAEGRMERLDFTFYDPVPTLAPPNDDLELQLVWLDLVKRSQGGLSQEDFAKAWIDHIHYMWDEYGRCRWNLRRGVPVECVGTFENHFHAGMGSPIRSEIWATLFPGDPDSAAYYAALDASLDHGMEGIAGEVFLAVMQSKVAAGAALENAVEGAISYIPAESGTFKVIEYVRARKRAGEEAWSCWEGLLARYGNENFTHAPLNLGLTIWALLYGDGDFEKSILLAVNGGYDTDCTAATVGATIGLRVGEAGIPERWISPIGDGIYVGPGIQGVVAPTTLGELSDQVLSLHGKLSPQKWNPACYAPKLPVVDIASLPGTVQLRPLNGGAAVPWANGELPLEVKQAGGASWEWNLPSDESRVLICTVRGGARLYLDGEEVIATPAGLPYVPATHRSASGTRVAVNVKAGIHQMRLELDRPDPDEEGSVMLAYPNLHLCPWTGEDLPFEANLPV